MASLCTEDLLHPEILSRETLVAVLLQRQIKLDNSQRQDKEVLVEIFHRTVTPLAQREPRGNRRGRATAKKIKRLSGKKSFKLDESKGEADGSTANSTKNTQRGGLFISANVPSSKPRLKPPPVVRNRGIIKLNTTKSSSNTTSPKTEGSTVIKLGGSKSSLEGGVAKISLKSPAIVAESKKISLKRPSSEISTTPNSMCEESTASPNSSPTGSSPKKMKKITWP